LGPVFIDGAIAVVVFAVAAFFGGGDFSLTGAPFATKADVGASLAETFVCCASGTAITFFLEWIFDARGVVIDQAVTVVVFAIADLFGGGTCLDAATRALSAGRADLFACAFALADPHRAGCPQLGPVLIDGAVTVVVFAITDLGLGSPGLGTANGALAIRGADLFASLLAGTDPCSAGRAFVGPVLVGFTVAVVVFAIAQLGGRASRFGRTNNAPLVVGTDPLGGISALADPHRAGEPFLGPFVVGFTVAVVVFAVAQLLHWRDLSHTGAPFAGKTGVIASFAFADSGCGRRGGVAKFIQRR
jgi:hypothetical protein